MPTLFPASLMFDYQFELPRVDEMPRSRGRLLGLQNVPDLFVPARLNNKSAPVSVKAGWNERGLGVLLQVRGKKHAPAGRWKDPKNSDWIHLFVDTRHTAGVQRATEFCTSVAVMPVDEDADGSVTVKFTEVMGQKPVPVDRSQEPARTAVTEVSGGYDLELWLPGAYFRGFEGVLESGLLAFYFVVHDSELGEIPLSVGGDFPVSYNPSMWLVLMLQDLQQES
ncbi:MAG: hypothetical protein RLZZ458_1120 [Planctomycetota bacterium]|jgi:hypothetical protein